MYVVFESGAFKIFRDGNLEDSTFDRAKATQFESRDEVETLIQVFKMGDFWEVFELGAVYLLVDLPEHPDLMTEEILWHLRCLKRRNIKDMVQQRGVYCESN